MRRPLLFPSLAGTLLAPVVVVLLALALVAPSGGPVATVAGATLLLAGPALAVALPLRGVALLPRAVLALAAVLVVDTAVAEVMVSAHLWSRRGGVVAVAVVSLVLLVLVRRVADRDGVPAAQRPPGGGDA